MRVRVGVNGVKIRTPLQQSKNLRMHRCKDSCLSCKISLHNYSIIHIGSKELFLSLYISRRRHYFFKIANPLPEKEHKLAENF